uniref:Preprotein translocase subunit SecG n=1 Tax=Fervidicoccus fontis TaxID=683846 RepID=A0A7J3ZIL9_9CREN
MAKGSERKRRPSGPLTAAGLISFYEDTDARIKLTPAKILLISSAFVMLVVGLRLLF